MSMALLEVRDMSRAFGGLKAVDGVSFAVRDGAIKGIIGPNGAGKTTLFNLIAATLRPDRGQAFLDGERLTGLRTFEVALCGVARTFQTIRLCGGMSVLENVVLGRHGRTKAGFIAAMLRLPGALREEEESRVKAFELLELFGLQQYASQEATELPFGLQRGVELARALASSPRLLLLDEPASGLNIRETSELAKRIRRIRDLGVTILLVEHDMSLVMEICDEIAVLDRGRKIAEGTPEEVRRNQQVIDIYLGQDHVEAAEY
jgi:branched-chain amino acid transport system ATP-binding protein